MQQPSAADEAPLALRLAGDNPSKTLQPLPNVTDDDEPSSDAGHTTDDASETQTQTETADDDDPPTDPEDEQNLYADSDPGFKEVALSTTTTVEYEDQSINGLTYSSACKNAFPWMPIDEKYRKALDLMHAATNAYWEVWDMRRAATNASFDLKICRAPNDRRYQMVLDVGTGTGIWALEYADANPWASVTGIDICPIQPEWVAPNVKFQFDNFNLEWTWDPGTFDYIHARDLAGSIVNWSHLLIEALKCLKPNGYFETHEQSLRLEHQATDGPVDPTTEELILVLGRWNNIFNELEKRLGRPFFAVDYRTQRDLMMKVGFENLEVWRESMPIGAWAEDLETPGGLLRAAWEEGFESMLNRPADELGWSREEAVVLGVGIRKALRSPKLRLKVEVIIIVGQKPG